MSQVPSHVVRVNELPAWLSVAQAAEYCGVDRTELYTKMLRNLEIRRIGLRGGVKGHAAHACAMYIAWRNHSHTARTIIITGWRTSGVRFGWRWH